MVPLVAYKGRLDTRSLIEEVLRHPRARMHTCTHAQQQQQQQHTGYGISSVVQLHSGKLCALKTVLLNQRHLSSCTINGDMKEAGKFLCPSPSLSLSLSHTQPLFLSLSLSLSQTLPAQIVGPILLGIYFWGSLASV
mmetsp:Transcript_4392/g.7714  ORF Transcript_4392/g.7714 Transcript_4392/m.7714 type:complete len:137 (-) Transcript_4392:1122-1532(-)